jgi:hypothetical protein
MRKLYVKGVTCAIFLCLAAFGCNAAGVPDLNGHYLCEGRCDIPGGDCYIWQHGTNITVQNERKSNGKGTIKDPKTIEIESWKLTGKLDERGGKPLIIWHKSDGSRNDTSWALKERETPPEP